MAGQRIAVGALSLGRLRLDRNSTRDDESDDESVLRLSISQAETLSGDVTSASFFERRLDLLVFEDGIAASMEGTLEAAIPELSRR